MKLYNLTDVETPMLAQRGLVRSTIVVGRLLLEPGENRAASADQLAIVRGGLQELVALGALAVGNQPPAKYIMMKERATPPAPITTPETPNSKKNRV